MKIMLLIKCYISDTFGCALSANLLFFETSDVTCDFLNRHTATYNLFVNLKIKYSLSHDDNIYSNIGSIFM